MDEKQRPIILEYCGSKISVSRHVLGAKDVIYRIVFENGRPPLVITKALQGTDAVFWTSIPEGRQKEAEEVGAFISEYFKSIQ